MPDLKAYLGRELTELPGIDAICYFMRGLSPEHSQKIIDKMISALNRKKFFDSLKTDNDYILLGVDGVQTFSSSRPLEHSTHRTHGNGKTTFHKYFLEAKIISEKSFFSAGKQKKGLDILRNGEYTTYVLSSDLFLNIYCPELSRSGQLKF